MFVVVRTSPARTNLQEAGREVTPYLPAELGQKLPSLALERGHWRGRAPTARQKGRKFGGAGQLQQTWGRAGVRKGQALLYVQCV